MAEERVIHNAEKVNEDEVRVPTPEDMRQYLQMASEVWEEGELDALIRDYRDEEKWPKDGKTHKIATGDAAKLVNDIYVRGGTKEELDAALKLLIVCINAQKHMLNTVRYAKDHRIKELRMKYQPWRFPKKPEEKEVAED